MAPLPLPLPLPLAPPLPLLPTLAPEPPPSSPSPSTGTGTDAEEDGGGGGIFDGRQAFAGLALLGLFIGAVLGLMAFGATYYFVKRHFLWDVLPASPFPGRRGGRSRRRQRGSGIERSPDI